MQDSDIHTAARQEGIDGREQLKYAIVDGDAHGAYVLRQVRACVFLGYTSLLRNICPFAARLGSPPATRSVLVNAGCC
jgi:hypothetical protein